MFAGASRKVAKTTLARAHPLGSVTQEVSTETWKENQDVTRLRMHFAVAPGCGTRAKAFWVRFPVVLEFYLLGDVRVLCFVYLPPLRVPTAGEVRRKGMVVTLQWYKD